MAQAFIEHVNITVSNPENTAAMLCAVFDWHIRWKGPSALGGRTIHVGSDTHYLAVYTPAENAKPLGHAKGHPLNHVGIEVDDLAETERRVIAAGFTPFNHGDYAPGRRFYFFDRDGVEFEIVSYAKAA